MEKKMENEMEAGVMLYGLCWGYNGKENGNYYHIIEFDFLGWMNGLKGTFSIGGRWGLLHIGEKGLACYCRRLASSGLYACKH